MALVCNPLETDMRPAKKARFSDVPKHNFGDLDLAAANEELRHASADDAIRYALKHCGDAVALTTSFGIGSALMLHLVTRHKPDIPVIWIDTGYLPKETYHYARTLQKQLNLNLQVHQAKLSAAHMEAVMGEKLWETDHKAYGKMRKVEPMGEALRSLSERGTPCVLAGLRAAQTNHRKSMKKVNMQKTPVAHYKVCPILDWSREDVDAYFAKHNLPQHPLKAQGYTTVGDVHSSAPSTAAPGMSELEQRATRFGGKTQECGLHLEESDSEESPEAPSPRTVLSHRPSMRSPASPASTMMPSASCTSLASMISDPAGDAHMMDGGTFIVFGRAKCGWCSAVKAELKLAGHSPIYVDADTKAGKQQLRQKLEASQSSLLKSKSVPMPQVFFNEQHLGGFEEAVSFAQDLKERGITADGITADGSAIDGDGRMSPEPVVFSGDAWLRHRRVVEVARAEPTDVERRNASLQDELEQLRAGTRRPSTFPGSTVSTSPRGAVDAQALSTSKSVRERGEELMKLPRLVSHLACNYVETQLDRTKPVIQFASPDDIYKAFSEASIPLSLIDDSDSAAPQQAVDLPLLQRAMEEVLRLSVRTSHPHFLNQLYGRVDPAGVAGEWVSTVMNSNSHTFEVAPVNTLIEHEVLRKMASVVGGKFAGPDHDGLFVAGGSLSNLYGMHLGRAYVKAAHAKAGGAAYKKLVAFTSAESHYSYLKGARLMGMADSDLRHVPLDEDLQMCPAALDAALTEAKRDGCLPFFVGATAGTTVFGAFDPVAKLAEVCAKHGVWLHVDGAWGGAVMLSKQRHQYVPGIDLADSIAWNPHKFMGAPLQCAAFLTRHRGLLAKVNSAHAAYLFQPDKEHTEHDVGDKTLSCGRKTDAIKIWTQWKALGDRGLTERVDHGLNIAQYWVNRMMGRGGSEPVGGEGAWAMVRKHSWVNICFWYVPPSMRPFSFDTASDEAKQRIGLVAPAIKARMQHEGKSLIGFQSVNGLPNFFRLVLPNPWSLTFQDVDEILETMDAIGRRVDRGMTLAQLARVPQAWDEF